MTDKNQILPLADRVASIENALAERLTSLRARIEDVNANGVPGPFGAMIPKELPGMAYGLLDETCTYAEAIFSVLHELTAEAKDAKDRLDRVVAKLAAQNDVIEDTHSMIANIAEGVQTVVDQDLAEKASDD